MRPLSKPHLLAKIALFGIFLAKFFDRMHSYALKIFRKICSKIANFFKQSRFQKRSLKRNFSLLEVLIAFLIISISIPMLMAPFVYASVDQKERVEKMRAELAAQFALTAFLVELQQGTIPISQIVDKSEFPMKEEWFRELGGKISGVYTLRKLNPVHQSKDEEEEVEIELWEAGFLFNSLSLKKPSYFPFKFTIVRGEVK